MLTTELQLSPKQDAILKFIADHSEWREKSFDEDTVGSYNYAWSKIIGYKWRDDGDILVDLGLLKKDIDGRYFITELGLSVAE